MTREGRTRRSFIDPRRAPGRLLLATAFGLACAAGVPVPCPLHLRGLVFWDTGSFMLLALAWNVIFRSTPELTQARAEEEDPGRNTVGVIAVASSLFSLFAGVVVLRNAHAGPGGATVWTALALAAVGLSWSLVHTSYTLRYARLFYRKAHPEGGLLFPGTEKPSDIDFAYFAFGIGMTFQTGDVQVTASRVRRTVMFHALIAFVLNTVIVALALNVMVAFLAR
jgi:uncharacterized membrane protein